MKADVEGDEVWSTPQFRLAEYGAPTATTRALPRVIAAASATGSPRAVRASSRHWKESHARTPAGARRFRTCNRDTETGSDYFSFASVLAGRA